MDIQYRTFESGAKRDAKENDGWFLLPPKAINILYGWSSETLINLGKAMRETNPNRLTYLVNALYAFRKEHDLSNYEILQQYADVLFIGQQKYEAFNWEKGIPLESFISSAYRHYIKFVTQQTDENHLGSFIFNLMGAILTNID